MITDGESLQKEYREIQANIGTEEDPTWMDLGFQEREAWNRFFEQMEGAHKEDFCAECSKVENLQGRVEDLEDTIKEYEKKEKEKGYNKEKNVSL